MTADLFGLVADRAVLRDEAKYGKMDALSGLPLHNEGYSANLPPDRFAAYAAAYRAEVARMRARDEAKQCATS